MNKDHTTDKQVAITGTRRPATTPPVDVVYVEYNQQRVVIHGTIHQLAMASLSDAARTHWDGIAR